MIISVSYHICIPIYSASRLRLIQFIIICISIPPWESQDSMINPANGLGWNEFNRLSFNMLLWGNSRRFQLSKFYSSKSVPRWVFCQTAFKEQMWWLSMGSCGSIRSCITWAQRSLSRWICQYMFDWISTTDGWGWFQYYQKSFREK